MNRLLFAISASAALLPTVCFAADPCAVLGLGTWEDGGQPGCFAPGPTPLAPRVQTASQAKVGTFLAAEAIVELRAMRAEVAALRVEFQTTIKSLQQAKTSLDAAAVAVATKQEAWQKKALTDTVDSISNLPVKLAEDPALRAALAAAMKLQLATDPAFVHAVKQAALK